MDAGGENAATSELEGVFAALEALATEAGIEVRTEPFTLQMAGKGGLCRIKSRRVILVDARLSLLEQVGVVGEALGRALSQASRGSQEAKSQGARVPEQLVPYLRTGHAKVGRLLRPRPLARGR